MEFFDPTLLFFILFMVFYYGFLVRQIIIRRKSQDEDVKNITGPGITDIDLPFGVVLKLSIQFFAAGLILTFPFAIIFMIGLLNS